MTHGTVQLLQARAGQLFKLANARGTTLRVACGVLWITQERSREDVVLGTGDVWTIENDGLTLIEAQAATALQVTGRSAVPADCAPPPGPWTRLARAYLRWSDACASAAPLGVR